MKVGVNLINFGPSANPEILYRWVQVVEGLGYHSLLTSDHLAVTPDVATRYPAPLYEPISTLGWLAAVTNKIQIGTTVAIVPYRNPIETARSLANIDQLSGGRLIFGVGVGWAKEEFSALGIPYRERGNMTNEYLTVIKQLWTEDKASFHGKYISYVNIDTAPNPLQNPHPPIWVGGSSDAALRRVIMFGDAWHPIRFDEFWLRDEGIPRLKALAQEEGVPTPSICPRIRLRILEESVTDKKRLMGTGSSEQVHHDIAVLENLGCEHVILDTYYDEVEATRNLEASWRMLSEVAETMVHLSSGEVR